MTNQSAAAHVMPPEWERHERTWMSFPTPNDTFGERGSESLERARDACAEVALAVARYEPVVMVMDPADEADARARLGENVTYFAAPLDDAWMRDSGPTFVRTADGELAAVNWVFNGWGAQDWAAWDHDALLASRVAAQAGVPRVDSQLVNEGGGIHIDGKGTVLLTESVQMDPGRNPGVDREEIEREIHSKIGTTHAVWVPYGLTRDNGQFGTRGHIDIVACFTPAGDVLLHMQNNPDHPDYKVSRTIKKVLEAATNAEGEPLRIIEVPAPQVLTDDEGWVDYSYINHYVGNDCVILCGFNDPNDEVAVKIMQEAYPGRTVELVDAREIFACGGGIHCITQQQPVVGA